MFTDHGESEGTHLGFHRFHVENHALARGADRHELHHHEGVHLPREVEHAHCSAAADRKREEHTRTFLCPYQFWYPCTGNRESLLSFSLWSGRIPDFFQSLKEKNQESGVAGFLIFFF